MLTLLAQPHAELYCTWMMQVELDETSQTTPCTASASVTKKADVAKLISKGEATIVQKSGKSEVWNLFGKVTRGDEVIKDFVACKSCKKVYAFKPSDGTQSLRKHSCDTGPSGPAAKKARIQEPTSFNWNAAGFSKAKIATVPKETKTELNKKTVLMCALDFRPLSVAAGDGFQIVAQKLVDIGAKFGNVDVKTLFKDRTTYSRKVLPEMAMTVRKSISEELVAQFSSMPSCLSPACFVCDHWTDNYRSIEFTSIGVSFVDKQFVLQSYDLCVSEYDGTTKHAVNIKEDLMRKLESYVSRDLLQKNDGKFVIVSDSDAKLVAAVRDDFDRQSCIVHDLSLCVKAALKSNECNDIGVLIADSKTLVRYFKKTGLNHKLSTTLKQDVSTRFNTICTMLESIDKVYDEVTVLLTRNDALAYITNIKRKMLKFVCHELKRFEEATKTLASEKDETLHLVVPVLTELKAKLMKQAAKYAEKNEAEVCKLCSDLAVSLDDKCLSKLTWYHFAAVILSPALREHPCMSGDLEREIDRVRLDLHGVLRDMADTVAFPLSNTRQKPKSVLKESDSESEDGDEVGGLRLTVDAFAYAVDDAEDELDKYGRMSYDCEDVTPLRFWKDHAARLPKLSTIARSVLAIPASQNKTERSFSAASHVLTDLRTMLDPEHVDELLLIRSHHETKSE